MKKGLKNTVGFSGVKYINILDLGISQLYLNERKINRVKAWFSKEQADKIAPLPVHDFGNGRYTLTDGHTRAYVAYSMGIESMPVVYDNDDMVANSLGQALYINDILWCERFNLKSVADLEKRIVSDEEYERLWLKRCTLAYNLINQTTENERKSMQDRKSNLYLYGSSSDLKTLFFEDNEGNTFGIKYQDKSQK